MKLSLGYGPVALGLALAVQACGSAAVEDPSASASALEAAAPVGASRIHTMPMLASDAREAAPVAGAGTQLTYYGGPVIANVVIHAVYWGNSVAFQSHLNDFYRSVTNSSYMDWLSEYNTPTQQIGRGTFAGAAVIRPGHTGTSLSDADIQAELSAQMDAGVLPQSDGKNDLYMIHFPPSVSITADGNTSCVQFCAYHGTFKKGDTLVFYGVHPDLVDTNCAQGCGGGAPQDNTTSVASHEMVEAITDAAVGVAPADGPPVSPMAWYNEAQGEIGDICNARQGRVNGFTVQLQWSNRQNKCVASGPAH
jgi:hypothetical protein